jgi:hypothetical protein
MGIDNEVIVGPGLRDRLKEEVYTWYVDRDHYLLRYMCNRGFFRNDINPICKHCELVNSRDHATDECDWYRVEREKTIEKIARLADVGGMSLSEMINKFYFDPGEIDKKNRKSIIRYIKEFVFDLFTKQKDDLNAIL